MLMDVKSSGEGGWGEGMVLSDESLKLRRQ